MLTPPRGRTQNRNPPLFHSEIRKLKNNGPIHRGTPDARITGKREKRRTEKKNQNHKIKAKKTKHGEGE